MARSDKPFSLSVTLREFDNIFKKSCIELNDPQVLPWLWRPGESEAPRLGTCVQWVWFLAAGWSITRARTGAGASSG